MPADPPLDWRRDPLVQFGAVGVAIFGLFAVVHPSSASSVDTEAQPAAQTARTIIVDPDTVAGLDATFRRNTGRAPTPEELDDLERRFVDEEIMFREARGLGFHRTDPVVRRRVLERLREREQDQAPVANPTEDELRQFLKEHPERYRTGVRLDFEQLFISRRKFPDAERIKSETLAELLSGADPKDVPGKYSAGSHFTLGRVAGTYGQAFAEVVADAKVGVWTTVKVDSGFHLVRLTKRDDGGTVPPLSKVRGRVERDWRTAQRIDRARALADALRPEYVVVRRDREGS